MRYRSIVVATVCAAAWLSAGEAERAHAQPSLREPGSVLIYPLFDSGPGAATLIQLTNTNRARSYCQQTDTRAGDVRVRLDYVDPTLSEPYTRYEFLVPGDSLTVLAGEHAPDPVSGYVVVSALDPEKLEPFDFDFLIGSAIVAESAWNVAWTYAPYSFRAIPESGDICDREPTDPAGDDDGALDFDGVEYDLFPRELVIDTFFEHGGRFNSQLALVSFIPEEYASELSFLFWNNVEQKFSRALIIDRWWRGSLREVSAIVEGLGGDEEELVREIETGFCTIEGKAALDENEDRVPEYGRPPILGVFMRTLSSGTTAVGSAIAGNGALDGLEFDRGNLDPQETR